MADISKCTQTQCPKAAECYRRTAPEGHWQSWMTFKYKVGPNGVTCDHFIPTYQTRTTDESKTD